MKAGSTITIGLLLIALTGLILHDLETSRALDMTQRNIKQIEENCIVLRKTFIVEDLQTYLNSQPLLRYHCGEIDGVWGKNTNRAVENFMFDENAVFFMTPSGVPKYE